MKFGRKVIQCIVASVLVFALMPVSSFADEATADSAMETKDSETIYEDAGDATIDETSNDEDEDMAEDSPDATNEGLGENAIQLLSGVQDDVQIVQEGDFGVDGALHWIYREDASLTISGAGAIPDYTEKGGQPWNAYLRTIEALTIEEGITEVGAYAFYECRLIEMTSLPSSLTRIGAYAFYHNDKAKGIEIADSISSIGSYAFAYCAKLGSFKAPSGLTELEDGVLMSCGTITVDLHSDITRIGKEAFSCDSLKIKQFPSVLESIGSNAFDITTILDNFMFPIITGETNYFGYFTVCDTLEFPEGISTATANEAISSCKCQYVKLPKSLLRFTYAPRTNMPAGVTKGFYVDPGNPNYSSIEGCLFSRYHNDSDYGSSIAVLCACPSEMKPTSYTIPDGTRIVLNLPHCANLIVSASVEQLPSFAGLTNRNVSSLETFTVDEDNEYFASIDGILYTKDLSRLVRCPQKYSMKSHVVIPEGVQVLDAYAFSYCTQVEGVSVPEGVRSIPSDCFYGCYTLAAIFLPCTLEGIGMHASSAAANHGRHGMTVFYAGSAAEWNSINVSSYGNDTLLSAKKYYNACGFGICPDNLFYYVDKDETLHIEPDVQLDEPTTAMANYTDDVPLWIINEERFVKVEMNRSITAISDGAFQSSEELQEVILHHDVKSVGKLAFADCPKLAAVKCFGNPLDVVSASQSNATFDAGKVTILYLRDNAQWIEAIDTEAGKNTWRGYAVMDFEPDGLPRIASAQLTQNGHHVTDVRVVGETGVYVDPHRITAEVLDADGNDIADKVDIEVVSPQRKRPLGDGVISEGKLPYFDEASGLVKVPCYSPEGECRVIIKPRLYESDGEQLELVLHITRVSTNGSELIFKGTQVANGATRTLRTFGRYANSDRIAKVDVCNRFFETVYDECDVTVVDTLNNQDVTNRTKDLGFSIADAPNQGVVVDNMAIDRTYAIAYSFDDGKDKGRATFNLRIEREPKLMNVPYSLTLQGGNEVIELGDTISWSSKPLRVRVLDGFDDPCWPELGWVIEDANGNDVSKFFQVDGQGYIKVDPSLKNSLDASGALSTFKIIAQARGVIGYDAEKDSADMTPMMRSSNEITFSVKRQSAPAAPVTHTATFKVGDEVIGEVVFEEGDSSLNEPVLPPKANYMGEWGTYDLASKTDDFIVEGIYSPMDPDKVSEVGGSTSAEYDHGLVTINLMASSATKNIKVESNTTKPVDVVMVLDRSGSMNDNGKLGKLKQCANAFVQKLYENAEKTGADHRVALAGFAMGAVQSSGWPAYLNSGLMVTESGGQRGYQNICSQGCSDALLSVNAGGAINERIVGAIDSMTASGATAADVGLDIARRIFAENPVRMGEGGKARERIVLFITDGVPTSFYDTDHKQVTSTAAGAISMADTIKNGQGARIYSVGVDSNASASAPFNSSSDGAITQGSGNNKKVTSYDFNRFLHAISSNYPGAKAMSNLGTGDKSAGYYMAANNTASLDGIFTTILYSSVYDTQAFDRATLSYVLPAGLVLTMKNEGELRAQLLQGGIASEDIEVVREGSTTRLLFHNVPVSREIVNGVSTYVARVSFQVSVDEGVSGTICVGESAMIEVGGQSTDLEAPSIQIPSDRHLVVFKINDEIYEIRDMGVGDTIIVPDTDIARWLELERQQNLTVKEGDSYVVFETSTLTRTYTLEWLVGGVSSIETHSFGDALSMPSQLKKAIPAGMEISHWSPALPQTMPARNLICTAVLTPIHTHTYTASSYMTGSCDEGLLVHEVCACGEERESRQGAKNHAYQAYLGPAGQYQTMIEKLVCDDCGRTVNKNITYKVSKSSLWAGLTVLELDKVQNEVIQSGPSDDDISIRFFVGTDKNGAYKVYRIDENGIQKTYNAVVKDGYLTFDPDHFSIYVIDGPLPEDAESSSEPTFDQVREVMANAELPEEVGDETSDGNMPGSGTNQGSNGNDSSNDGNSLFEQEDENDSSVLVHGNENEITSGVVQIGRAQRDGANLKPAVDGSTSLVRTGDDLASWANIGSVLALIILGCAVMVHVRRRVA